jgi:hypothetical protein
VERMFGTLQHGQAAKACGICDIAAANRFILEVYLPAHNARFAKPPALPESVFVAVADPVKLCDTPACRKTGSWRSTTR